jgi:hypothetical protein
LSNGQNDYLHARLGAIPIRRSTINAAITEKSGRLLFHAAKQAHRKIEFAFLAARRPNVPFFGTN